MLFALPKWAQTEQDCTVYTARGKWAAARADCIAPADCTDTAIPRCTDHSPGSTVDWLAVVVRAAFSHMW